jgi:hypothetical protein
MPRDTSDIGTHGLEQGGGNLGNDYSRPVTTERNEQNTTTNVGSHPTKGNQKQDSADNLRENMDTEDGDEGGSMPDPETLSVNEDDESH